VRVPAFPVIQGIAGPCSWRGGGDGDGSSRCVWARCALAFCRSAPSRMVAVALGSTATAVPVASTLLHPHAWESAAVSAPAAAVLLAGCDIHRCKPLSVRGALCSKGHARGCHAPISLNRKAFALVRGLAPVYNPGPELALRPQLAPGLSVRVPQAGLRAPRLRARLALGRGDGQAYRPWNRGEGYVSGMATESTGPAGLMAGYEDCCNRSLLSTIVKARTRRRR
jgi:hypothetical protein